MCTVTVEQEADFFRANKESPNRTFILGFIDDELVATANVMASPRRRLRHRGVLGKQFAFEGKLYDLIAMGMEV